MKHVEVNFDGLVGPTHNYAGLAWGNVASTQHRGQMANPKAAVQQGLRKMHFLMSLGIPQAILPFQPRPNLQFLHRCGLRGSIAHILQQTYHLSPQLLAASYSAASMWTANAATVSPSIDTGDGKLHITPANLVTQLHRQQEASYNFKLFKYLFADQQHFTVHQPLPNDLHFADEGAANQLRLCQNYGSPGIEIFIYGRHAFQTSHAAPKKFPARQTELACKLLANQHQLHKHLLWQQHPDAIDQGVFHNDVIAVANENVLLYHPQSFVENRHCLDQLNELADFPLHLLPVQELTVPQAVQSYFFNSQLVTISKKNMALILPMECKNFPEITALLQNLKEEDNPINAFYFIDCQQSMENGGGPACLRLRIVMDQLQLAACHQGVFLTEELFQSLWKWSEQYYRDQLYPDDLLDPALYEENVVALEALLHLLQLPMDLF